MHSVVELGVAYVYYVSMYVYLCAYMLTLSGYVTMIVCVCVCERERERERESTCARTFIYVLRGGRERGKGSERERKGVKDRENISYCTPHQWQQKTARELTNSTLSRATPRSLSLSAFRSVSTSDNPNHYTRSLLTLY
jgi:hypothetical protein